MTKDYTPTTDEIKNAWAEVALFDMSADSADAAFDRWLAKAKAEAWGEGYLRGYRDRRLEKSFNPHQEES